MTTGRNTDIDKQRERERERETERERQATKGRKDRQADKVKNVD